MKTHKTYLLAISALLALLLLSACGSSTTNNAQNTPPLQVLQNSYNAMKQLKSAHFTLQLAEQVGQSSQQSKVTITASGDEVMPDKAQVHVTELGLTISAITIGRETYFQNARGKWYVLQLNQSGNALAGTNVFSYNTLLALASKAHFVDHGLQTLNGQSLRHITATLDKSALQQIISANLGSLSGSSQANLKQILNKLNIQNTTLDLWIDPSTSYVMQMELKYTMNINTGAFVTPTTSTTSSNMSVSADTIIDYSKFNAPVTITAPSHAIPATSLSGAFGG